MSVSLLDLSADELIARGIAPIRKEYRLAAIRYRQHQQPTETAATADDDAEAAGAGAGAAAAAATGGATAAVTADGEGGHKRVKSKRQKKRERQEASTSRVCVSFMLGGCRFGTSCKFSHDMDAYMAAKPPDLPGCCPFSTQTKCPYGLSCRWAGTHSSNGNSTQQQQQQQGEQQPDAPAVAAAAAEAGAGSSAANGHSNPTSSSNVRQGVEGVEGASVLVSVHIPPFSSIQAPVNIMAKGLQQQLWKKQYDFSRAAAVCAQIKQGTAAAAAAAGSGAGGGGSSKQQANKGPTKQKQQQQQEQEGETADAPVAKKQRIDPTEPAAAAAPESAALATAGAGSDAVMADAPPPAPARAAAGNGSTAAAAAATAAAVAAAAAGPDAELDELYADTAGGLTPHNSLTDMTPTATTAGAAAAAGGVSDADLLTSLKQEQQAQQQQQQQGVATAPAPAAAAGGGGAVGCVGAAVSSVGREPRSAPKLDIAGKTYLAPLTTVGNLPFRRVCVDLGCEVTCGEMAVASNLLSGQAGEWALLKRHPSEKFFGVQVCGGYTDQMAQVSQLLDEQLGDNIDFVDINCGCPIDVICNKGAGSSLLLRPRRLEEVVRAVTTCIHKPVIVKIRKGYYDNADVAHDIIPQMPLWGAAAVTLHGRSRQQRYSRAADWDYIRRCARVASSVGLPLIGNGDVFSPMEWQQRLAAATAEGEEDGTEGGAAAAGGGRGDGDGGGGCGVATAMIGRAALIKPWIFTEIHEGRLWDISASERLDLIRSFVSHGLEAWGSDSRGVETTRRFLLEWLSFTHRYIPVGLLEVLPQVMSWRPPAYSTRNQLEGLLSSDAAADWVKISGMMLGPAPSNFTFVPKHKSSAYTLTADALAQLVGATAGAGAAVEAEDEGEENG